MPDNTVMLQVEVPEELRRRVRAQCVLQGVTMTAVVEGLLRRWLSEPPTRGENDGTRTG